MLAAHQYSFLCTLQPKIKKNKFPGHSSIVGNSHPAISVIFPGLIDASSDESRDVDEDLPNLALHVLLEHARGC